MAEKGRKSFLTGKCWFHWDFWGEEGGKSRKIDGMSMRGSCWVKRGEGLGIGRVIVEHEFKIKKLEQNFKFK